MAKGKIRVLVTAVGAEPGRNVVKALTGKKEIEIIVGDNDPLIPVLYNRRETAASYILPRADSEEEYVARLTEITEKEDISVVLPCIEDEIFTLSKKREYFAKRGVNVVAPDFEQAILLSDKKNMAETAVKAGIPVPRTLPLERYLDGRERAEYPLIIKPRMGRGAKKVLIIREPDDMKKALSLLVGRGDDFIVQPYIEGRTGSIFLTGLLYGKDGRVITEFVSRSLKTLFEFGGTAMCGEPIKGFDRLKGYSRRLVEEAGGWYGPINMEYKISAHDGIPYILEANPRFWGYGLLAVKSGINFPYLAVLEAIGKRPAPVEKYRDDVILLRELIDTVVPKSSIKKKPSRRTVAVYEMNADTGRIEADLKGLSGIGTVDKVVLTGDEGIIKKYVPLTKKNEKISCYAKQVSRGDENIREIGICNFADVIVHVGPGGKALDPKRVEKNIDTFFENPSRFFNDGEISIWKIGSHMKKQ